VRDLLLGSTPKDFDIATSARPRQVKRSFRKTAGSSDDASGSLHVMFGATKTLEVSTFRRDPTPKRSRRRRRSAPRRTGRARDGDAAEVGKRAAAPRRTAAPRATATRRTETATTTPTS